MKSLNYKHFRLSLLPISLGLVIFAQALIIAKLYTQKDDKIYQVNITPVVKSKDSLDLLSLKKDLRTLEQSTTRLAKFLKNKQISTPELNQLSKDSLSSAVYLSAQTTRYAQTLLEYEEKLKSVPIGHPSDGRISSSYGKRKNPLATSSLYLASTLPLSNNTDASRHGQIKDQKRGALSTQFHKGIDFAVPRGTTVRATAQGQVIFAGDKGGYGKCVIIKHEAGLSTLYAHLSKINVKVGQKVQTSERIALSGNSGRSTGPHVHYEVHKNGRPVNPKLFVNL